MRRPARLVLTLALSAAGATATAQPVAPTPPAPTPPAPLDNPYDAAAPDLDLTIAHALLARAHQLLDAGFPEDAMVLAHEALTRTNDPAVNADALALIDEANRRLGTEPAVVPPKPDPFVVPRADIDQPPHVHDELAAGRFALGLHGGLMGAVLGGGIALAASNESVAVTSVAGVGGGVIGYFAGRWAARRWKIDEARARTIGSGAMIGAASVGLFADVVKVHGTTPGEIGIGASIGTVVGAAGGALIARGGRLSTGDVALMDSFALYGIAGGLTVGLVMQPVEGEAYSLNAVIGGLGGWLVGAGLGPRIDASPRRVTRMMLGAVALGGAPWLVYLGIKDSSTDNDEQAIGLVSTVGIVTGAYLGYRWSKRLAGGEVQPANRVPEPEDIGATALLHRDHDGGWTIGSALPHPAIVDGKRGWMLDVAGGAF